MILLDTDIISHLLRPHPPANLVRRVRAVPMQDRFTSAISTGELLYGIERTGRHEDLRTKIEAEFIARIEVLPFDLEASRVYGRLKARLHSTGRPLAEPDLRIAAIAIANGLTLITGNESHFRRVPGLKVKNWLRD